MYVYRVYCGYPTGSTSLYTQFFIREYTTTTSLFLYHHQYQSHMVTLHSVKGTVPLYFLAYLKIPFMQSLVSGMITVSENENYIHSVSSYYFITFCRKTFHNILPKKHFITFCRKTFHNI